MKKYLKNVYDAGTIAFHYTILYYLYSGWKVIFGVLGKTLFWGVLGAWMTFEKAEMAKTLRNGLSMIETNPLNHKWLDFAI